MSQASSPIVPRQSPPISAEVGPDPRAPESRIMLSGLPSQEGACGIRYDFNQGFRLLLPETLPGRYLLKTYDLDSLQFLDQVELKGGDFAQGKQHYFIRYRLELYSLPERKLIFAHDYNAEGKPVFIIVPDGGLGDCLAWLPYVPEFQKKEKACVTCVCGEWAIRFLAPQYPELHFSPAADPPDASESYAAYICAIFPEDKKFRRPVDHQNSGMQGSVARLLGLEAEPRKVRLPAPKPRTIAEPYVCISAMATNPCKYWNYPDGWNILCRYLKRLGFRVLVIDRDSGLLFGKTPYFIPKEAENFTGRIPIAQRMELLQNAAFFIGLPSGLSWLAWNCDIPVVMLSGFTLDGSEFPTPYRVTNFHSCHGCWNDSNCFFDMSQPTWCPRHHGTPREIECTRAITPKMVMETVRRIPCVRERILALPPVRISVLCCVYSGKYIRECVHSIVRTFAAYGRTEILLYEDASPEEGVTMLLRQLAEEYPDMIRLFHGEKNVGIAEGRAFLTEKAKGDYLVSFDHDDLMLPFDVDKVVSFLDAHPEVPASYAPKYLFDEANGYRNEIHGGNYSEFTAFFAPQVNINAAFLRKSAVQKAGGFLRVNGDKRSGWDDIYLFTRLAETGSPVFDPEARTLYRIHRGQITASHPPWDPWITRQRCEKHRELYERILAGDIPSAKGDDFRLVRGLMGAALFLHQREKTVTAPIMARALKEFPEDPGVWSIFITLLRMEKNLPELEKQYPEALQRCARDPMRKVEILAHCAGAFADAGQTVPPELRQALEEAKKEWLTLPEWVRPYLPQGKTGRPTYSFC